MNPEKNSQKIQIYPLIETLVLGTFTIFLLYLRLSGRYLQYLTPSTGPWLSFASIMLFALALQSARKLRVYRYRPSYSSLLFLLLPLFFFLIPTPDLRSSRFSGGLSGGSGLAQASSFDAPAASEQVTVQEAEDPKRINDTSNVENMPLQTTPAEEFQDGSDYSGSNNGSAGKTVLAPSLNELSKASAQAISTNRSNGTPVGELPANGTIILSEENYAAWVQEVYKNPKPYNGYRFELLGYIFAPIESEAGHEVIRAKSKDDFAVARLAMICCAADMASMGFYAVNDSDLDLEIGDYYQVGGVLRIEERELAVKVVDEEGSVASPPPLQPVFHLETAEPVPKPMPEYVLPFFN